MSTKPPLLAALLGAVGCAHAVAADVPPPAARWIPQDTVIAIDLHRPRAILRPLLDTNVSAAVATHPSYESVSRDPKFQELVKGVTFLAGALGTDWRTGLARLTGGGVHFALGPQGKSYLIVDTEDADLLQRLHGLIVGLVSAAPGQAGGASRVQSQEYRGLTGWTIDGQGTHVLAGGRLIVSGQPEDWKTMLDLRQDGSRNLASNPAYAAAQRAVGPEADGMLFADLRTLKQLPALATALRQPRNNPLGALLFSSLTEAVQGSDWMALGLYVKPGGLVLRAFVDGRAADPKGVSAFALPKEPGDAAPRNLDVPGRIAALSLHRDLHGFYAAKNDLFPERTSGLIFFENMMGIFFSGRDLTEDVLAHTLPDIRLVVARQDYTRTGGPPETQIPAFAVVFRVRDPKEFDPVVEEAWQKALGLVNFTRGQKAQPGLVLDRATHAGTTFSLAGFSAAAAPKHQPLPTHYNFRPALAMPGDYVILSSTDGLARDLMDALGRKSPAPDRATAGVHSLLEMDGREVAALIEANRTALVRQNMVKEGATEEAAQRNIGSLVAMASFVDRLTLDLGMTEGRTRAQLELGLKLPTPPKAGGETPTAKPRPVP